MYVDKILTNLAVQIEMITILLCIWTKHYVEGTTLLSSVENGVNTHMMHQYDLHS